MITARRMREARERESLGLPPTGPPAPERIAFAEHQREVAKLNQAHARALTALRLELEGGSKSKDLEAQLKAASAANLELENRVRSLEALLAEATEPADAQRDVKKGPRSRS
jgi:hypothetical protein